MAGGTFEADGGDAGFEDRGFGGRGTHERLSYPYDVFLSHSAKDKSVVRELAERLRAEGLSVWFDEWEIQGGHSIPERLADGLQNSRVLLMLLSRNFSQSDWAQYEGATFLFRDPQNRRLQFVPVQLEQLVNESIPFSIRHFARLDWLERGATEFQKVVEACRRGAEPASPQAEPVTVPPVDKSVSLEPTTGSHLSCRAEPWKLLSLGHAGPVYSVSVAPDGQSIVSGSDDGTVRVWDQSSGQCTSILEGHAGSVYSVVVTPDGQNIVSGSDDGTIRVWDRASGQCTATLEGHSGYVRSVAVTPDGQSIVSGSGDRTVRVWDRTIGKCIATFEGHAGPVYSVAVTPDGQSIISGSDDSTIRVWDRASGQCTATLEGHSGSASSLAVTPDGQSIVTGSGDRTVRVWDRASGQCTAILEGHTDYVYSVAVTPDGQSIVSGSDDRTVRVWDLASSQCTAILERHFGYVYSVTVTPDGQSIVSGSDDSTVCVWNRWSGQCIATLEGHTDYVRSVAVTPDGHSVVSGSDDGTVRLWDRSSGKWTATLEGHSGSVRSVTVTLDGLNIVSGSDDKTVRVWNRSSGQCIALLEGHSGSVLSVAVTPDGQSIVSGSGDKTVRIWDRWSHQWTATLEGHSDSVRSVAVTPDGQTIISGSDDETIRVWDRSSGECTAALEGHSDSVWSVAVTPDGQSLVSGSDDNTVRVWDRSSGECIATLEGHTGSVLSVAVTPDGQSIASGSGDTSVRVWDRSSGACTATLEGHSGYVNSVAVTPDGTAVISAAWNCVARQWQLRGGGPTEPVAARYTNAKVFLVGESGVGKTGLARWMATGQFEKTESTDAHWATRLSAEQQVHHTEDWATRLMLKGDVDEAGTRREIWLWDFAGQADYRLIHQLFMDETSLAVLVFNPQTEQLFDSLGRWDTDIARAARREYRKLLVAGRIDRGNLRASRDDLDTFLEARNFDGYLETSAKDGTGCSELVNAICNSIDWDRLTMTVSNVTWDRMKNEILAIRDGRATPISSSDPRVAGVECSEPPEDDASEGGQTGGSPGLDPSHPESEVPPENTVTDGEARVLANAATEGANDGCEPTILIRLSELNQRLRMTAPELSYKPEELVAVVDALARPGLVWKLDFGGFVLLHPDRINSYAGAVARELRNRPDQLGVMAEDRLTRGDFDMAGVQRVSSEDEAVLLQAMHQTFVDRGLALRQKTSDGTQLVFPAYFGVQRPEEPDSPPLFATYEFSGFLDDVYATLVVRLYYAPGFEMDKLWRDYAQFHSETGRRLCIELTRGREGRGSLKLHCEAGTADDTRVLFSRYVHEHLAGKAHDVERSRHYACPTCGKPFLDDDEVREAVSEDGEDAFVFCSGRKCREKIPLWDAIEQKFASDEFREKVRRLHEASKQAIDNESRELILIGHAFSIAGEAGQIFRPIANSDWGIDGEIEFKDYAGYASGKRVYLQLKHGDSYLTPRKRDDREEFRIKNPRWAEYWIAHEYPVMLVIRTSDGRIRWINATEELQKLKDSGHWPATHLPFGFEDFNPYNLLQIRRRLLGPPPLPVESPPKESG